VSVRELIVSAAKQLGSESKLADACGVSQNAIWQAESRGRAHQLLSRQGGSVGAAMSGSAIIAELIGHDRAQAGDIIARSRSPVFALYRALLAAGANPNSKLECGPSRARHLPKLVRQ
jgi:hypothetical protein